MKKILICLALTFFGALSAFSQTVTFLPTSAPIESTALSLWRFNAASALKNGVTTWGTPGTPGYFDASDPTMLASDIVSTPTFASWHGSADPGTVFGSGFASQLGNSYRIPFIVMKGGSQFSMSQITGTTEFSGSITSTNSIPALTGSHSSTLIGILYGTNGVFGGGDDTYITTGLNTQLLDAFIYNASSNTFTVSATGVSEQERLNNTFANIAGLTITTTISLSGSQIAQHAQTFQAVSAIPEPWHYALALGAVSLGFVALSRYRSQTSIA